MLQNRRFGEVSVNIWHLSELSFTFSQAKRRSFFVSSGSFIVASLLVLFYYEITVGYAL